MTISIDRSRPEVYLSTATTIIKCYLLDIRDKVPMKKKWSLLVPMKKVAIVSTYEKRWSLLVHKKKMVIVSTYEKRWSLLVSMKKDGHYWY